MTIRERNEDPWTEYELLELRDESGAVVGGYFAPQEIIQELKEKKGTA